MKAQVNESPFLYTFNLFEKLNWKGVVPYNTVTLSKDRTYQGVIESD